MPIPYYVDSLFFYIGLLLPGNPSFVAEGVIQSPTTSFEARESEETFSSTREESSSPPGTLWWVPGRE